LPTVRLNDKLAWGRFDDQSAIRRQCGNAIDKISERKNNDQSEYGRERMDKPQGPRLRARPAPTVSHLIASSRQIDPAKRRPGPICETMLPNFLNQQ
jgi:hypothetical protein